MIFLAIVIGIILGLWVVFANQIKGRAGEFVIATHARMYLGEEYILLNDCTLKDEQQRTTQIDHILISPYGIFVIETKNYKGWIFGSKHQKQWTQKIYKKSYKFQNPLHQNYRHLKVLQMILADLIDEQYIHSLVVFTPRSTFKTAMPTNVFQGASWVNYVQSFQQKVIPDIRLKRVCYRLEKEVLEPSWKTNQEHIRQLAQHHQKNDD